MLATILKSPVATQTTIGIIETFAKVKELSRTMSALQEPNDPHLQERLAEKGSRIISDLLDDAFETTQSETTIECNLVVLKVKHTITRKPKEQTLKRIAVLQFQGGFFRYILACLEYKIYIHLLRL